MKHSHSKYLFLAMVVCLSALAICAVTLSSGCSNKKKKSGKESPVEIYRPDTVAIIPMHLNLRSGGQYTSPPRPGDITLIEEIILEEIATVLKENDYTVVPSGLTEDALKADIHLSDAFREFTEYLDKFRPSKKNAFSMGRITAPFGNMAKAEALLLIQTVGGDGQYAPGSWYGSSFQLNLNIMLVKADSGDILHRFSINKRMPSTRNATRFRLNLYKILSKNFKDVDYTPTPPK